MRFRLLRRRLTISAPSMTVRGALPWPLRWVALALMLGFSAAIGLWAFEFGKSIAGLDKDAKEELLKLRAEVAQLRQENDKNLSIVNTSGLTLVTEKAEKDKLNEQLKQLEIDNRALRDDLGFFEKLTSAGNAESLAIRSLQAELVAVDQLRWQALVICEKCTRIQRQARINFFWLPKRQAMEHDFAQWTRAIAVDAIQTRRRFG
jgi:chromosome segregation ATPase